MPGNTLIFIDEIQECLRAIAALRYFWEEIKDIHVIAAGSLLEFVLNNKTKSISQLAKLKACLCTHFHS